MKNVAPLIAGLAMMLLLASCFVSGDSTERQIRSELKEEGWEKIQLEETEDGSTWNFKGEALCEDGTERPIICKGTFVYDDGIYPTDITVYGMVDGKLTVLGVWAEGDEDWTYTDAAESYLYDTEVDHDATVEEN